MEGKKTRCPICKKEAAWDNNPFRPFCSERCRIMDLGTWASEGYRIAGEKKEISGEDSEVKNNKERAG
jgi:endogenous inhibitor of DNA gyrase (YacG/DUF329 family)